MSQPRGAGEAVGRSEPQATGMEWQPEATDLLQHVCAGVPPFVRGMVRRVVTSESERVARVAAAPGVSAAHVEAAFRNRTPRPMAALLERSLRGKVNGSQSAAPPVFPVGEPMTAEEIEAFLAEEGTGRLGTVSADGRPYVVPLSFVYDNGGIYYHWFNDDGRKVQNIAASCKVCFEADWSTKDQLSYKSVIADGVIEEVLEIAEKGRVLRLLEQKFPAYATGAGHSPDVAAIIAGGMEAMAQAVRIFRVRFSRVTGKKKGFGP